MKGARMPGSGMGEWAGGCGRARSFETRPARPCRRRRRLRRRRRREGGRASVDRGLVKNGCRHCPPSCCTHDHTSSAQRLALSQSTLITRFPRRQSPNSTSTSRVPLSATCLSRPPPLSLSAPPPVLPPGDLLLLAALVPLERWRRAQEARRSRASSSCGARSAAAAEAAWRRRRREQHQQQQQQEQQQDEQHWRCIMSSTRRPAS